MIPFVDSHAHLADPAFDADRDQVIERARVAGARAIVCIGESLDAARRASVIAAKHDSIVFFTAGVHPHDASGFDRDRDLPMLETQLRAGARAVGECGLDFHYENSPREAQREAFAAQMDVAGRLELPLVVHTRDAERDTESFLGTAAQRGIGGVLHCFTGTQALAKRALDSGWYVSFSGIITFKSWTDEALLKLIPDDRLLAESDAPYLAPIPNRGKRNEPAWVSYTIGRLATARRTTEERLGALLARNAERFFTLPPLQTAGLQ